MSAIFSVDPKEYIVGKLNEEISEIRLTLIEVGMNKGLQHPETLKLSIKLDKLLNEYQKLIY